MAHRISCLTACGIFPAATAKSLQLCPTLCDPIDGSHQAPLSLGFSRQEHWSGLPFPSPMHESEKWKWSLSVVSDFSRPHGLQPTRLLHPWGFSRQSTGVGCHCLLRESSRIRDQICVSCIGRQILYHWTTGEVSSFLSPSSIWSCLKSAWLVFRVSVSQLIPCV